MSKLLIANRSEIACRIIRTARMLGIPTVAIFTPSDSELPHRFLADESYAVESYSDAEQILSVIRKSRADLVHPGYGFLSEQSDFVRMLERNSIRFVGPTSSAIDRVGDKATALELAGSLDIPTAKGVRLPELEGENYAPIIQAVIAYSSQHPFPLLLKARSGGGGRGMRPIQSESEITRAVESASREALLSFGDPSLVIERKVTSARHIEVQVIADQHGNLVVLGDRDCSLQRSHQKVIEEAPASFLSDSTRAAIHGYAEKLLRAAGYQNAGTVEFLVNDVNEIFFLEVNPRLQVEHPVTEITSGFDIVELQLKIAQGARLPELLKSRGTQYTHAVEARICAEVYFPEYRIATGTIQAILEPTGDGVRFDAGYRAGNTITHLYDSLIGKLITYGETREIAFSKLRQELRKFVLLGVGTSVPELLQVLDPAKPETLWRTDVPFNSYLRPRSEKETLELALGWVMTHYLISDYENAFLDEGFFRLGDTPRFSHEIKIGENMCAVTCETQGGMRVFKAGSGDRALEFVLLGEYDLKALADQMFLLSCPGFPDIHAKKIQGGTWLQIDSRSEFVKPLLVPRANKSEFSAQGITEIRSHLPGKLLKQLLNEGDLVEAGGPIAVLESMKMENQIKAGASGKIKKWYVGVGQVVQVDEVLVEIES